MKSGSVDWLPATLVVGVVAALVVAWLAFAPSAPSKPVDLDQRYFPAEIAVSAATFADLPGWRDDDQSAALAAFRASCRIITALPPEAPANPVEAQRAPDTPRLSGAIADWLAPCARADAVAATAAGARAFFEQEFRPLKIATRREPRPAVRGSAATSVDGLFTAYFEPVYAASLTETSTMTAPVLARPDDLVTVDLGAFRNDLAGVRLAGRVEDGALAPYPDRAAIEAGALGALARPIAWLNPDDLFFLQIQGSGRLKLPGGAEIRVAYDGQNGQPYVPIGRILIERRFADKATMSMQKIRTWLAAARPADAAALRQENPSYVFFRRLEDPLSADLGADLGPVGAGGARLVAGRSLAVDRRFYAMGAPLYLALDAAAGAAPFRRLMIAQDTGGAIVGPLRADVFLGSGPQAGDAAGRFNVRGRMFVLLPTALATRALAPKPSRAR